MQHQPMDRHPEEWIAHDGRRLAEEPTGELVRELVEESRRLVRDEARLVKAEMKDQLKSAARGGALVACGAAVAVAGVTALAFTLLFALGLAMALWLSALITGVVFIGGGALLARAGFANIKLEPEKAIKTLEEDKRWANDTMHRIRRTHARA